MKLNYLIIPLAAVLTAVFGSLLTSGGMDWYKSINIPSWTPSGQVIGMVWTAIFILSAISALIFWNSAPKSKLMLVAVIFLLNAVLNIFWSYLFFSQHMLGWAAIEAGLLGLSVVALIILIWPVSVWASVLLLPYAGWVCFATYLTTLVYNLNN